MASTGAGPASGRAPAPPAATQISGQGPRTAGADTLPEPGERIGQYELIRELGRGGMGAVFLARDTRLGRLVAIKFLQSNQPELTSRFILEARATAQCSHENIVIIHEVGEHFGNPFMVLEFLEGSPLSKLVDDGRTLPAGRAIEIMVSVVRALAKAHDHKIVHRDLKPDNIFITDSGTVKVLDFGIAKVLQEQSQGANTGAAPGKTAAQIAAQVMDQAVDDSGVSTGDSSHQTKHGAIIGTLPYMSPEQWGVATIDHRTDIWAVGILLFRMIVGQHPLGQISRMRLVVTAMLDEPMPSARGASPNMPDELAAIIDRCLMKYKDQRFASAQELLRALEPLMPGRYRRQLSQDQSPYAGLSAFQEADADRFFGRSNEIAAAVTRLRDQPLLGVVGPSGAGKSSFVRAGVVPTLKHSGETWVPLVLRPGLQPLSALAEVLTPMVGDTTTSSTRISDMEAELGQMRQRLLHEPGLFGAALRGQARSKGQKYLIFVDQFEELYTLVEDPAERRAFTACLNSAADDATSPLRVVISIRSDFLDRVPEDPHFMANLTSGLFFLMAPGVDGMREALIQPADMAGYQFEDLAIVEDMLAHLRETPGALPLLQFAATKLWELRDRERRLLTVAAYQGIGGITGALASHADSVMAELPPGGHELARALFLRLVTPERTRAIVPIDELRELSSQPGAVQPLIDKLVKARLLVVQTTSGGASVEIVHESLVHRWPLLRRWLDDNQDDAAHLEQLRTAARQWQAKNQPVGLLWRGEAATEAQRWHKRYRGNLTALEQAYLQAVFALNARSQRRKRALLAAVMVILVAMVVSAAVALVVIRDAQKEAVARAGEAEEAKGQALDEAERARAANEEANEQRERAEKAQENAEEERTAAESARTSAEEALEVAEAERQRAEAEKRRARRALRRARRQERAARQAKEELARSNADLEVKLEKERQLREEAEKRNKSLRREMTIGLGRRSGK